MSQINFYVLPPTKTLIPFVCQLTQTALQKSDDTILLLMTTEQLEVLNEALWSFSDTAFIPHEVIPTSQPLTQVTSQASVLLTDNPKHVSEFDGVVINLLTEPLLDFRGVKLLEIITADETSVQAGRQKYRAYQQNRSQLPIQTFRL